jgi:hypothetical protein
MWSSDGVPNWLNLKAFIACASFHNSSTQRLQLNPGHAINPGDLGWDALRDLGSLELEPSKLLPTSRLRARAKKYRAAFIVTDRSNLREARNHHVST